jgi:hydrophobic/amphiphilic exporter-1 (mainly G- bacteria), HAE1 family
MKISHFAVRHPVIIGMLLIVLVVFGIYSFAGMNVEFMADISLPTVEVLAVYPGAGAKDVEEDITNILERDFVTLPNFKNIDSVSSNSLSWITITFQDDVDPYDMLPEIRNRIRQLINVLPDSMQGEPIAIVGGATMLPIVVFSVEGGADIGRLSRYVEETLIPRITRISGVAEASVMGDKDAQVTITLRIDDLLARNIAVAQVHQILTYANMRIPVGTATWYGRIADVRYDGAFSSLSEIGDLPIGSAEEGRIIRLSEVADIQLAYPEPSYFVDSDGKSLMVVTVTKRSDGNTLDIARQIKQVLADSTSQTGNAISYNILSDDSQSVTRSLFTVTRSGLMGVVMAILVILLFLNNSRATLIIGLSIPLSILFTFIGMRVAGVTINLMSLSGLVIALGMVVDGSIVMLEQAFRLHSGQRKSAREAILLSADQVGSSIFASATTTIAVFIPISMLSGIIGSILRDVSLTLIFALTASLLVALVVVPFLLKILLKDDHDRKVNVSRFNRGVAALEKSYRRALTWSLASRKFILIVSLSVLVVTAFVAGALGITFIPSTDTSDFYVDLEFPKGYSIEQTRIKTLTAENLIREAIPEIQSLVMYSGRNSGYGFSAINQAYARIVLIPTRERERSVHSIILVLQEILSGSLPDTRVKVTNGGFDKMVGFVSGGGGYGLTLTGEDMELLYSTATRIRDTLALDPDVVTTEIDASYDTQTLVLDMIHSYMSSVGVNSAEAGLTTSILFQGVDAGRFSGEDGGRYDIRLESNITDTPLTVDTLAKIQIPSLSGEVISFAAFADIKTEKSISQINHSERAKTITVSGTLVSEDTSNVVKRMNQYIAENPLPTGIQSKSGGILELISGAIVPMLTALVIALFLVYTVMVIQFERFRQPLIVMASVPFCLIGVVLGLLIFGSTVSMISVMAVIALGGMVVNNGIILIDSINLLRKTKTIRETTTLNDELTFLKNCITDGGASRLRPILMTTLTTMLGVVPMAIARGEGAEMYAPLGQAIAGGLLTSTLITLFIIPVLYYITEKRVIRRRAARVRQESNSGGINA